MNNSATAPITPHGLSAWTLIWDASPIVKLVLLILLSASVITWAIIFTKSKLVKNAKNENAEFLDLFWNSKGLDEVQSGLETFPTSPIAKVFASGYKELRKLPVSDRTAEGQPEITNIERALNRAHSLELDRLEKYLDYLASTASAAPFIGLFGTVWGIMSSFQNIGAMGSASLSVVAPGISEALIATAVGLAAAIPAAVAYNFFLGKVKRISLDMENFTQDFLNMIQRSLLSQRKNPNHGNEQPTQ
jgi:biopolymer transport protein TolQ